MLGSLSRQSRHFNKAVGSRAETGWAQERDKGELGEDLLRDPNR